MTHSQIQYRYCEDAHMIEAGCDEAGRGCLAGAVFAAAVILPQDFRHPLLNDSKQLSRKHRDILRPIIEREAISFAVSSVSEQEIDRINILKASILGMHRALESLRTKPDIILVDGNRFIPYGNIPHVCIVKGDAKFAPISAASVLAKCHRDEYMETLSREFPQYSWDTNMGYPTAEHLKAIRTYGITPYHRKTFNLHLEEQLSLF